MLRENGAGGREATRWKEVKMELCYCVSISSETKTRSLVEGKRPVKASTRQRH